ncbi:MAG TPA: hypothetical protein VE526_02605 [Solirubrobacteraceae bacterium]|nr:hypothetical protein [Solirubrobacteraceae bacterium]
MRRSAPALCVLGASMLVAAAPASAKPKSDPLPPPPGATANVQYLDNLPEARYATAINFLKFHQRELYGGKSNGRVDVMLVTGRFGLKTYSLRDRAHPELLGEVTAEELRLPGDPAVSFPQSTFWQNEDMDVDDDRRLAMLSRDPRAYRGSTSRDPYTPDPNGAINVAGVYIIDVNDPRNPSIRAFEQLPTGHTTTCVNDCRWLWTGGPASTTSQVAAGWTFGRPIIVTDLTDPSNPVGHTLAPVDLFRRDGVTAYSHDVDVDAMGIAWVSGDGGTRGYWTEGTHVDPLTGQAREATPLKPIPYGGGGIPAAITNDQTGGFEHNAIRPVGATAPQADARYEAGELLLSTEEDFGPANEACSKQGMFAISSLAGSYNGEAWKSTPASPFRLKTVGTWNPYQKPGSRPQPATGTCSAHYFDLDGDIVSYAWYAEGTRFLDISDPENPIQVAYWRPNDTNVWAAENHRGYIYTSDANRGVDVLKLTASASTAGARGREVTAPAMSKRQLARVAKAAARWKADPATAGICLLQVQ